MQWKKLKMTYNGLEFYQMRAHLYVARMDLISSRNVWVCIGGQFNFFWRHSPLVGLGLLLIHEDFCGF